MTYPKHLYILIPALFVSGIGFYAYAQNKKTEALRLQNTILEKQNETYAKKIKKLQKDLRRSEKKIESLESLLKEKLSHIAKESRRNPNRLKKSFYTVRTEKTKQPASHIIDETKNNIPTLEEELEMQIASILAQNGRMQNIYASENEIATLIPQLSMNELGKKYVWGATGPECFDCSGFTSAIYKKLGIRIPRVSREQAKYGAYVTKEELKTGDLVFFDTSKEQKGIISHVGIYLGENRFIHASSAKHRVVISSLNNSFYKKRFKWGRRVLRPKRQLPVSMAR